MKGFQISRIKAKILSQKYTLKVLRTVHPFFYDKGDLRAVVS